MRKKAVLPDLVFAWTPAGIWYCKARGDYSKHAGDIVTRNGEPLRVGAVAERWLSKGYIKVVDHETPRA